MDKWNLIVDVALCENCHNCTLATKDEHVGNDFPGYAAPQPLHGAEWIRIDRRVRGEGAMVEANYRPRMCNHCDDAPCLQAAGNDGAIIKRDDGITIIDPQKARGRRDLVGSCPYGAISWNDELELPQIWIFDAHLLDQGWKEPRCVQSCPTGALRSVKISDESMQRLAEQEQLQVLEPQWKTRPRVHYRNLHLYASDFLGGSVVAEIDGREECVEDAEVTLYLDERRLATTRTDGFGDFKFDGMVMRDVGFRLEVRHAGLGQANLDVVLSSSRYVDPIRLDKGRTE